MIVTERKKFPTFLLKLFTIIVPLLIQTFLFLLLQVLYEINWLLKKEREHATKIKLHLEEDESVILAMIYEYDTEILTPFN